MCNKRKGSKDLDITAGYHYPTLRDRVIGHYEGRKNELFALVLFALIRFLMGNPECPRPLITHASAHEKPKSLLRRHCYDHLGRVDNEARTRT